MLSARASALRAVLRCGALPAAYMTPAARVSPIVQLRRQCGGPDAHRDAALELYRRFQSAAALRVTGSVDARPGSGGAVRIVGIDHVVMTCRDVAATVDWYKRAVGVDPETFVGGDGIERQSLQLGTAKYNLMPYDRQWEPKAQMVTPGSIDICFHVATPVEHIAERLRDAGIEVHSGPVRRTGAMGPILSVYARDPDGNLIEFSNYIGEKQPNQ